MSTLEELAEEYRFQPYELAAFLGLGARYDAAAEIHPEDEAEFRHILDNTDEDGIYQTPAGEDDSK